VANSIDLFVGVKVTIERTYTPEGIFRELQKGKAKTRIGGIEKWEDGNHLNFDRIIISDRREPQRDGPYQVIIRINPNTERRSIGNLISNPPKRGFTDFATALEVLALILQISAIEPVEIDVLRPLVGISIACPGSILSDNAVIGFALKYGCMRAHWISKTCDCPYFEIKQYQKIL
jgi:hypothetical protein